MNYLATLDLSRAGDEFQGIWQADVYRLKGGRFDSFELSPRTILLERLYDSNEPGYLRSCGGRHKTPHILCNLLKFVCLVSLVCLICLLFRHRISSAEFS